MYVPGQIIFIYVYLVYLCFIFNYIPYVVAYHLQPDISFHYLIFFILKYKKLSIRLKLYHLIKGT